MATPIRMPSLGAGMTDGLVARWLKGNGDWVDEGEPLVEVETDKIVYAIESPSSGLLHRVMDEEASAPVGGVLGFLLACEESPPSVTEFEDAAPFIEQAETGPIEYEVVPLTGMRKVVSDNMMGSLQRTAQYTICMDADVTELVKWRRQLFEGPQKLRVSLVDVVIKAVAEVLQRHPRLNAVWVDDEIRVCKEVNISFAVALNEGLVVPVVRNADSKSLAEIAQTTRDLARRARSNRLTLDETRGGTFTVTAPGFVDACTPILNYPQCAILGLGRIVEKPVVHQGEIVPRSVVVLSLSLDHRAVDGAPAAAFMHRLQRLLEEPGRLFEGL